MVQKNDIWMKVVLIGGVVAIVVILINFLLEKKIIERVVG